MRKSLLLALLVLLLPSWALAAISFVTGEGCTGTTSCTTGSGTQANDLLFAFTFRDGNNNAPTVPGTWNVIANEAGGNSNGSATAWKLAAGGAEASGTFSNATTIIILVYRGVDTTDPIGDDSANGASGTTATYSTLEAMQTTDGTSWVIGCAGSRAVDSSIETAPSGMTNRTTSLDGTDEVACADTTTGVSSWPDTAVVHGGTSTGWRTRVTEIRASTATDTPFDPFGMTGFFGT